MSIENQIKEEEYLKKAPTPNEVLTAQKYLDKSTHYKKDISLINALKVKSKFGWTWYLITFFWNLFIILSFIYIFVISKQVGIAGLIHVIVSIPIFFINIIIFWVRFYFDKNKIKTKVKKTLGRNFIIANFLTNSKRIVREIHSLNTDGFSFDRKKATYIVDKETIWFDEEKNPNAFFIPELPNSLKFNFTNTITSFFEQMQQMTTEDKMDLIRLENDISFSSENLQQFKKDKIFKDLNKQENTVDEKTFFAILGTLGGIVFLLVIGIIIAVVV